MCSRHACQVAGLCTDLQRLTIHVTVLWATKFARLEQQGPGNSAAVEQDNASLKLAARLQLCVYAPGAAVRSTCLSETQQKAITNDQRVCMHIQTADGFQQPQR